MDDPDPDSTNIVFQLIILLILILINAFFAMSEIAIITLNDNKVRRMADEGHVKAKKILKLTENPSSFLSTIQIGVTLAGFLTSASAAESFSKPLASQLAIWFNIGSVATISFLSGFSMILVTIIIAFFSLVLGELAPKRIGMQRSEEISFRVVGILLGVKAFMKPFIRLLSASTNLIVKLLGFDPNAGEAVVTEEEIRMMVDAGEEKGVIEESQKDMINNIFEFDDIVAADVMTHRTEIVAIELDDNLNDVLEEAINEGYSRIPVYREDLDDIVGIIYVKDLLKFVGKEMPDSKPSDIMRSAIFVPESKRCGGLFSEMTEQHLQMVIVSDEYGGTAGLVTIEDLLESIVGNMQDEYDDEEEEFQQLSDTAYTFDGTADIEEVEEILDINIPEGEYDTIGGYIMSVLGRIPVSGEHPSFEAFGYTFTVEDTTDRRISKVHVEKLPEAEEPEKKDEK